VVETKQVCLLGGLLTATSALVAFTSSQFTAMKSFADQRWPVIIPLLVTTIYTAIDAVLVMWTALSCKELEHGGNTPKNLANPTLFSLDLRLLKFSEAMSYQGRIEKNLERNEQVGSTINRGIKAACLAPLIFIVFFVAAYFNRAFFVPPVERIPLGGGGAGGGTGCFTGSAIWHHTTPGAASQGHHSLAIRRRSAPSSIDLTRDLVLANSNGSITAAF